MLPKSGNVDAKIPLNSTDSPVEYQAGIHEIGQLCGRSHLRLAQRAVITNRAFPFRAGKVAAYESITRIEIVQDEVAQQSRRGRRCVAVRKCGCQI